MRFLDAPSYLYKRLCPYVGLSIRRSVCPVLFLKVKKTHTRRILCRVSGLVKLKATSVTWYFFVHLFMVNVKNVNNIIVIVVVFTFGCL